MSENPGAATHGGAEHAPTAGQEALPVEEKEQSVTRTVGSAPQTVHEDALVLTQTAPDDAPPVPEKAAGAGDDAAATAPRARTGSRSSTRARAPKQDAVLTEAVALAREAVVDSPEGSAAVGEHLGVVVHEDRLLTHLFECRLRGYPGWTWYATVARAPRTKHVTVCESGLIAGPDSLLAPAWVPWEERMQAMNEQEGEEGGPGSSAETTPEDAPQTREDVADTDEGARQATDEEQETSHERESSEDGASS